MMLAIQLKRTGHSHFYCQLHTGNLIHFKEPKVFSVGFALTQWEGYHIQPMSWSLPVYIGDDEDQKTAWMRQESRA